MTVIEDKSILHQIYLEQYKNHEAQALLKILSSANKQITKIITETKTISSFRRYEKVKAFLEKVTGETKKELSILLSTEGEKLIETELNYQKELLTGNIAIDVDFALPGTKQVWTAATFAPLTDGMTFESMLEGIQKGLYTTWDTAVRTGYLTGQSTARIIQSVMGTGEDGAISKIKNSIISGTKTALQSFAAEARNAAFKENEDLFEAYKCHATLDRRTCLICARYDGKKFVKLEDAPRFPIHRFCRCVLVPVLKEGFSFESERSSEFGSEKENITYSQWLKKQSAEVQREVLGAGRYKLYESGESITSFTAEGRVLTLDELKGKR